MDQFSFEINGHHVLAYRSVYAPVRSNMFTILTGNEAVVFDPNEDEVLLQLFKDKGIEKVHILLTHGHYDHISGVEWLKEHTGASVFCQAMCADRLANSKRPLSRLVAMVLAVEDMKDGGHRYQDFKDSYKPFTVKADITFDKEADIKVGELEFHVTSTPGHSEGSSCYTLFDKMVFTGDTLLKDYHVILKFPGGNKEDYESKALPFLQSLPKDCVIMPGHGEPFILKETKNI